MAVSDDGQTIPVVVVVVAVDVHESRMYFVGLG
jgi:hypothetical protein